MPRLEGLLATLQVPRLRYAAIMEARIATTSRRRSFSAAASALLPTQRIHRPRRSFTGNAGTSSSFMQSPREHSMMQDVPRIAELSTATPGDDTSSMEARSKKLGRRRGKRRCGCFGH